MAKIGSQDTFALKLDSSGTATWAKSFASITPGYTYGYATATDASGNTYLAGTFDSTTLTFGSVSLARIGPRDTFVAKLDVSGTVLWAKNFGGSGAYAYGQGIAVDGSGNVYLGGYFTSANLTTPALPKIGNNDAFALKLDSSGATTWAKNFGGSGAYAIGDSIAFDGSGNVYLGGYYYNADLTTPALTKIGTYDAFAFKLDNSGATTWAKNFGGSGAVASGQGIAVDGSGNVYLGGYFNNANLTTPALTKIGTRDSFTLKLSSTGATIWAKNFGGSGTSASNWGITVDSSENIYLGGDFSGANLTTPALTKIGNNDAFALKLDSSGVTTWAKNVSGSGASAFGRSIAVDSSGDVYLGGYFYGANLTVPVLTKIGNSDAFALKLDSSGATTWAKNFGGSLASAGGWGITVDSSGIVYLGGDFTYASFTTPALTKIGARDAFIIMSRSNNVPTALILGAPTLTLEMVAGSTLTALNASPSTDPDTAYGDAIVSYSWDLNHDGTFGDATGVNPPLTWAQQQTYGLVSLGNHTVGVRVTDTFGASSTTSVTLRYVDTTPPIVTPSLTAGTYNGSQNVTLTCSDAGSGCATVLYCLGSSCTPSTAYTGAIAITSSTTINWQARDNSGNSSTGQAAYTINLPPIVSTGGASTVTATTATLNGTVNENGTATTVTFKYGLTTIYGSSFSGGTINGGTGATIVSASISDLTPGTVYHYRITATNSAGTSYGDDATFTVLPSAPAAPVAASATSVTPTSFTANWGTVNGATGYRLDVSTDPGFTTFISGYNDRDVAGVASYSISGLTASTPYYYRVRAYNTGGTGTSSNTISLTTAAPDPVAGVCGSANTLNYSAVPATNLCNAGTASSVTGSGPWNWTCSGLDGGTTASCSALQAGDVVYRSSDSGVTWTAGKTGFSFNSNITALAVSPNYLSDHVLFIGAQAGVYKSDDSGDTWTKVMIGSPKAFAISPTFASDQTIFAGTVKSTDGGATWAGPNTGLPTSPNVRSLAISPNYSTDHTIFAGLSYRGSNIVFKSIDGGDNWAAVNTGLPPNASANALAISPNYTNDSTIFVATTAADYLSGGPPEQVYKSTNGGTSWTLMSAFPRIVTSLNISPNYVTDQALIVGTTKGIYKSIDGGSNWTLVNTTQNISTVALSPVYAIDQTLFASIYDLNIYTSSNGGSNLTALNFNIAAVKPLGPLAVSPDFGNDHTVFAAASLPRPSLSVTPNYLSFGSIKAGSSSQSGQVTISNDVSGGANLVISNMTLTGVNANQFSITPGSCGNLTPVIPIGSQCSVNVTFSPDAVGSLNATLQISSNGDYGFLSLIGKGVTLSSTIATPTTEFTSNTPIAAISGTATIAGGDTVSLVEVSSDSGTTWLPATGTTSWTINIQFPIAGSYTILSRATSSGGVVETPGAGITVTIDRTAPTITMTSTPMKFSNQASGTFTFNTSKLVAFECKVDNGIFATCTSPFSYSGLANSQHTTTIRATDIAGNPASISYTWNINTTLAASSAIMLPQTGQTMCYIATGVEIGCEGTGQDGDIRAGAPWPNPRFTDNGDGTVSDIVSGLTWTRDANVMASRDLAFDNDTTSGTAGDGAVTWQHALDYVKKLNQAAYFGFSDWRLPNSNELLSLVDTSQINPVLPTGHLFTNVPTNFYWTSNTNPGNYFNIAKTVFIGGFGIHFGFNKSSEFLVWPVRTTTDLSGSHVQKTGQTKCYDVTGITYSEVACTDKGQDGELQQGLVLTQERYTPNDTLVTDNLTGLIWPKDANSMKIRDASLDTDDIAEDGRVSWQHARDYVTKLNQESYLGFTDWRLPNVNELASLMDFHTSPCLADGHPFTSLELTNGGYWTSNTNTNNPAEAWLTGFTGCGLHVIAPKSSSYAVWPVRGGYIQQKLTVTKTGSGTGTITPNSGTFTWTSNTGTTRINPGDTVTLTATPDAGTSFTGWIGACTGTDTCQVTMDATKAVTATFSHIQGVCGSDSGKILAASAPTNLCDKDTPSGVSGDGHPWNWSCQGDVGTDPTPCNASIQTFALTVTVPEGAGKGDVQANVASNDAIPVIIFCPKGDCSALFDFGKTVKLTATPDSISLFTSWTGDCTADPCYIEITGTKAVSANFSRAFSFNNITRGILDNSLYHIELSAKTGDEIRMLATELTINSLVLNKALTLTGGWNGLHTSLTIVPTTLNGTLTVQDADSVIKGTTVKGSLSIRSGSLRVEGLIIRPQ